MKCQIPNGPLDLDALPPWNLKAHITDALPPINDPEDENQERVVWGVPPPAKGGWDRNTVYQAFGRDLSVKEVTPNVVLILKTVAFHQSIDTEPITALSSVIDNTLSKEPISQHSLNVATAFPDSLVQKELSLLTSIAPADKL